MIETVVTFIEVHLIPLGPVGVIVAAFIEELIAPLPSPVVMLLSGFFFLDGLSGYDFWLTLVGAVALTYAIGVLLASFVWYGVARLAGKPAIDRFGRFVGVTWDQVEEIKAKMNNSHWDEWSLFILRVIPAVPSPAIALFCGAVRFNLISYSVITFVGVMIRASVFGSIGWYAGVQYQVYAEWISQWEKVITMVFLILVILFFGWWYFFRRAQKV